MMTANKQRFVDRLQSAGKEYHYYSLDKASKAWGDFGPLPKSLKVLAENLLRHLNSEGVEEADLKALVDWLENGQSDREIAYRPTRVLMQDFTGVPAVVDLAAMREAVVRLGGDAERVNPLSPVDLVIDHSVMVDSYASTRALADNTAREMERNRERYEFLRWGQQAFSNFSVVPPGTGICHQVNLEYLGRTVWSREVDGKYWAWPDTLVGTDSHTTMINGLGILGWGVGGIEAEAAMLGQPISLLIPEVVGFELTGRLNEGITATDLVLTVVQLLRQHGVVGKFVEFYGDGLADLPLADRATIANMTPEFGATCGFFPVDDETLRYLRLTGRDEAQVTLVRDYAQRQGLWRQPGERLVFSASLHLALGDVEASLAGPKRPQDRVSLAQVPSAFKAAQAMALKSDDNNQERCLETEGGQTAVGIEEATCESVAIELDERVHQLSPGAVVIAAITSCTNTSNPSVLMAAGLLAKNAVDAGLKRQPWVKSSLAPGSKVVTDYLQAAGLMPYLETLGFHLVGYGCTTCIGNSGPLPDPVEAAIREKDVTVASVLSGNRNFEGRIHLLVKTNWLASPPLVVAYALAGNVTLDLTAEPLGQGRDGKPVYLRDIWPSQRAISEAVESVKTEMFRKEYSEVFTGDDDWRAIRVTPSKTYAWPESTYIRQPPFFQQMAAVPEPVADIEGARVLALLGDSVTTDHISPAGSIKADSPAGRYLQAQGVVEKDFNSYGSRRGNHEVMMRGTFANIRIRNEMVPGIEGGVSRHIPSGEVLPIYEVAMRYLTEETPLLVVAGKEYGTGSSRDWAAKGTRLLGVRAVLAESFERIHRSNLIGMGVLPLEFPGGVSRKSLSLDGSETFHIRGLNTLSPGQALKISITRKSGEALTLEAKVRIDTAVELDYYRHGGILHYVIRNML